MKKIYLYKLSNPVHIAAKIWTTIFLNMNLIQAV